MWSLLEEVLLRTTRGVPLPPAFPWGLEQCSVPPALQTALPPRVSPTEPVALKHRNPAAASSGRAGRQGLGRGLQQERSSRDHRVRLLSGPVLLIRPGGEHVLGRCKGAVRLGAPRLRGSVRCRPCRLGRFRGQSSLGNHNASKNTFRTVHTQTGKS